MRVYVPAQVEGLQALETEGRLQPGEVTGALAVTPWALAELDLDDPEDEVAEYAVLRAAAGGEGGDGGDGGDRPDAVLVFDLPGADLGSEELRVRLDRDLPRRRLVAVHVLPGLDWYAGHELPDVIALLAPPGT